MKRRDLERHLTAHGAQKIAQDRYGSLMPSNEGEAAALLDSYLASALNDARDARLPRDRRPDSPGGRY